MELTQQIFDKIKSMPHESGTEVAKKIGVSQATVSRVRSSVTLSEAKHKCGHKATEERKQKPSIVRTTENKKSVIKTTITGGEAKIEIIPKKSLFSRLFRRVKWEKANTKSSMSGY